MSSIDTKPSNLASDAVEATATDVFVSYTTSQEYIVVTLTYPGSWSVTPPADTYGYNATAYVVGSATNIVFDFTGVTDYTQSATFTFTEEDNISGPYQVTMSAPSS